MINKNPGYAVLQKVVKILAGDKGEAMPEKLTAQHVAMLKYAPITTCDVERSFSVHKSIYSQKRQQLRHKTWSGCLWHTATSVPLTSKNQ